MVRTKHETGLKEFSVEDNVLKCDGQEIARFLTPICELARLDDKIFVVLHPYLGKAQLEYAGTNLLALNMDGEVLWKARNLNPKPNELLPVSYNDLKIFEYNGQPKLLAGTTHDHVNPIIDIEDGKEIGGLGSQWHEADILKSVIESSTRYLVIVPGTPPKKNNSHPSKPSV
ncbi:MAG: hypothetical protein WAO98_05480 [Alphaproteobacteria bacterium]